MDDTLFQHIINSQAKWCKQYELQEKEARKERRNINAGKQWYGNSKEYKKDWDINNKRQKHLNNC